MRAKLINKLLAQLSLLAALSCQPSVSPETLFDNQRSIWDCHHRNTWSAKAVAAQLVGRWQWRYVSCELLRSATQNAGLTVVFEPDKTLTVRENGVIKQTARWEVVPTDNIWGLAVQPAVSQLHGRILFCDQTVEFNNSYIDGCDNYFVRY
ncbi:hypothetical protein [Spirosoma arcticum]